MKKIYNKIIKEVRRINQDGIAKFVKCGGDIYSYLENVVHADEVQYSFSYLLDDDIENFQTRKSPCTYIYDENKQGDEFEVTTTL